MKTTFKLNLAVDPWKTPGHVFEARESAPGSRRATGGKWTGGAAYTVPKALKAVRETLKAQGRAFTEEHDGMGWVTITSV